MSETTCFTLYVSRIIPLSVDHIAAAFDSLPTRLVCGTRALVLDRSSETEPPHDVGTERRCARAALHPGHLRRAFLVEVDVTAWSGVDTEIGIRPLGARRLWRPRPFCEAAHAMVDHLDGQLVVGALRAGAPLPRPGRWAA